jgi:hypothetical protein
MSTTAVSSTTSPPPSIPYWQQRSNDLVQLHQALSSGDLNAAKTAYNAIVQLGKTVPGAHRVPFRMANRERDFQAIGQALQSGDLAGARQALGALRQTFLQPEPSPVPPESSSPGPAAVVNLSGGQ